MAGFSLLLLLSTSFIIAFSSLLSIRPPIRPPTIPFPDDGETFATLKKEKQLFLKHHGKLAYIQTFKQPNNSDELVANPLLSSLTVGCPLLLHHTFCFRSFSPINLRRGVKPSKHPPFAFNSTMSDVWARVRQTDRQAGGFLSPNFRPLTATPQTNKLGIETQDDDIFGSSSLFIAWESNVWEWGGGGVGELI